MDQGVNFILDTFVNGEEPFEKEKLDKKIQEDFKKTLKDLKNRN